MKIFITAIYTLLLLCLALDAEAATDSESALTPTEQPSKSPAIVITTKEMERTNAFSLELLGRGGLYSFNYDHLVLPNLALGAGAATYSLSAGAANANVWLVPLYANYYFNENSHHRFFASGGADLIVVSGKVSSDARFTGSGLAGVVGGGYEYRGENGFLFRATPYAFLGKASGFWLGFSLGYAL